MTSKKELGPITPDYIFEAYLTLHKNNKDLQKKPLEKLSL